MHSSKFYIMLTSLCYERCFMDRRNFFKFVSIVIGLSYAQKLDFIASAFAKPLSDFKPMEPSKVHGANFRAIYGDEKLRAGFYNFLENVYSIYPNKDFHKLILEATQAYETDEEIYAEIQRRLPEITPFMALIRYSLPSLNNQKAEMSRQTGILLSGVKTVENYVEIGSPGTYVHGVKDHVDIKGDVHLLHVENPHYSPSDIVQRGQIKKAGDFVDMKDYATIAAKDIAPNSIDLVSNYIGFHHASAERRRPFIKSVADLIPSGGKLILRDHDVQNQAMAHLVALAHDVFNAGLMTEWKINEDEIRNFTTIDQVEEELASFGMIQKGDRLLQHGDPTINTLMIFEKI